MPSFVRILLAAAIAAAAVFALVYFKSAHKEARMAPEPTSRSLSRPAAAPTPNIVLPQFPWPPPAPSASYVIPAEVFSANSTFGQVSEHILKALEKSGYVERSFFRTEPGGVALVTRLERIADDGTPAPDAERWPPGFASSRSDFAEFLRGLFFAQKGHFRIIVFVLQDASFAPAAGGVSGDEAKAWLREGANVLPAEAAARPYGNSTCTALIYEFASDGSTAKLVQSALTGKQHLEKAGVLAALQ